MALSHGGFAAVTFRYTFWDAQSKRVRYGRGGKST